MFAFDAVNDSSTTTSQPMNNSDAPAAGALLAFAKRPLMAKSRRQWVPLITTGIPPTSDMKFLMSVYPAIMSGVGGKAAVVRGG
ncbi:MAG: hypothetical protein HKN28_06360 [Alphaproteobacteria bacterium]|nr:hypothetical protein [Alphaproteobacteria bacterium]